jgi:hypothetical protein
MTDNLFLYSLLLAYFLLLQTCCITQSSVVVHNGGYNFVVAVCCHHCCVPVSVFSTPQENAPHKAYRKAAWPHCISYSRHCTAFHACSTAWWVQCGVAQRTVIWTICHNIVSTCSNVYLLWALLVWILDCFWVPYIITYTRKFKKQGNSMSYAKYHHLTVDFAMWWACVDCMCCYTHIRIHFKCAVLLYNQFKDGTSGGNMVKHQNMQCDSVFVCEGCCTGRDSLSIGRVVLNMCIVM